MTVDLVADERHVTTSLSHDMLSLIYFLSSMWLWGT